jgi:hypothetical protein
MIPDSSVRRAGRPSARRTRSALTAVPCSQSEMERRWAGTGNRTRVKGSTVPKDTITPPRPFRVLHYLSLNKPSRVFQSHEDAFGPFFNSIFSDPSCECTCRLPRDMVFHGVVVASMRREAASGRGCALQRVRRTGCESLWMRHVRRLRSLPVRTHRAVAWPFRRTHQQTFKSLKTECSVHESGDLAEKGHRIRPRYEG